MLAQILPGFREIRGPLASGFLWLLLGYLIFHGDIASAHGKVKEIEELGRKLNPATLAAVASFVAYLLGSLSEDLFKRGLTSLARTSSEPRRIPRIDGHQSDDMTESFRETQIVRLENAADRSNAEGDLRVAILPPLVALILYLAINERPVWLLGLVFAAGLAVQVWLRTRDTMVVSQSLFELRRAAGVPPASAAEAKATEPPGPNVKLALLEHIRKGKRLLEYTSPPTPQVEVWADEASAFFANTLGRTMRRASCRSHREIRC